MLEQLDHVSFLQKRFMVNTYDEKSSRGGNRTSDQKKYSAMKATGPAVIHQKHYLNTMLKDIYPLIFCGFLPIFVIIWNDKKSTLKHKFTQNSCHLITIGGTCPCYKISKESFIHQSCCTFPSTLTWSGSQRPHQCSLISVEIPSDCFKLSSMVPKCLPPSKPSLCHLFCNSIMN